MMSSVPSELDVTLTSTLASKYWRLNNLYYINDKDGNLRLLKLNYSQTRAIAKYKHPKKIILKSRQQGISTLFLAYYLDSCLFKPGFQAGVQSYGRDESKKLHKRALLMWDKLDPLVKDVLGLKLTASNSEGMEFSNGSVLKIGNFRGDTLQGLHVSELAKISKKYPEKAKELKTGAFQAVGKNNKITIETTAEGNTGLFPEMWYTSMALLDAGLELTPLDFQPIFLSWMDDPDCTLEYPTDITTALDSYLKDLGKSFSLSLPDAYLQFNTTNDNPKLSLTLEQIYWLTVKLRELGDDFNQEYPATPEMAFAQSIEGTFFKKQYDVLRDEGRIRDLEYNPNYGVYTSWDLGMNDEMVILFWQVYDGYIVLIDEYHNNGLGLDYYASILREKGTKIGYRYIQHIFPTDLNVQEMNGRTRRETLVKEGVTNIHVLDSKLGFMESIAVARTLLLGNLYISTSCRHTISSVQNYRKKKDERIDAYMNIDIHDIHSNYMAAFRYGAQGLSTYLISSSKPKRTRKSNKDTSSSIAL